jgi:hypothetical protein
MNGQVERSQALRQLASAVTIDLAVETGTHRGSSTGFLADVFGCPVVSVEASPRFYHYARLRYWRRHDIELICSESVEALRSLRPRASTATRSLFYLDAHWHEHLPLWDELREIVDHWTDPFILIDDFAVPGDSDYLFDDYGAGQRLDIDGLRRAVPGHDLLVAFPAARAADESGARRGCCLVVRSTVLSTIQNNTLWSRPEHLHPGFGES